MDDKNKRTDTCSLSGRLGERVADLLSDHHYLHWSTQLDHFITVRSGGTPYGMYKQALRELDKRERGLSGMYADRERLQIDIEELEFRTRNGKLTNFDRRRADVDLRQKREAIPHNEQAIRDHERERDRFIEQAQHLRGVLSEKHGVTFPLSPEDRDNLDREMWVFLLKRDAATEVMTRGAVEKNTLAMIMSLPVAMRDDILELVKAQFRHMRETRDPEAGPLIEWVMSCSESLPSARLLPNSSPTVKVSA